jgi:hypothetical protein
MAHRDDHRDANSDGGMLKLPFRLRRDLILLLAIKLSMLVALYLLFFSPTHRPAIDPAIWIGTADPDH